MQMRQNVWSQDSGEPTSPRMWPRQMAQVFAPGTSLLLSESAESPSSSPSGEDADEPFQKEQVLGKGEDNQSQGE